MLILVQGFGLSTVLGTQTSLYETLTMLSIGSVVALWMILMMTVRYEEEIKMTETQVTYTKVVLEGCDSNFDVKY